MARDARWTRLAPGSSKFAVLYLVVAAALLHAPSARATNGGSQAYLPAEKNWCLGVTAPALEDVGHLHASVRLGYRDSCLFPATSSVEIRTGDGPWREVGVEHTKSGDRRSKSWTARTIRLSNLRSNTRYEVRGRIDYLGGHAHTRDLTFATDGAPARKMRAQDSFAAMAPTR
jgi:hypothetical protein